MNKVKPELKELKQFALMMSWAMPLFFFLVLPWLFGYERHWWPFVISAIFLSLYLLAAKLILYPYRLWMFMGGIIGWINTRIILGLTFYGLIFPMGLVLRLLGKLQYKNKRKQQQTSYYLAREQALKKEDLEQPF